VNLELLKDRGLFHGLIGKNETLFSSIPEALLACLILEVWKKPNSAFHNRKKGDFSRLL
jgi:hypothetical protein